MIVMIIKEGLTMPKQPYIPIYIGDWEKDTNCISPLAEFALLKLTFKLFNAEKRGVFYANFRALSVLFKSDLEQTKEIFKELIDNNILNIGEVEDGKFEIISRRMVREATLSEIRSLAGSEGGRGKKAKRKQNESKTKAKGQQNTDIDIEYIVKLLNEKSGKNFDFKNTKTASLILSRKKEGFNKEDFEKVIIHKCNEWLSDDKMNEYLRPQTLFSYKFEGYLQSVPKNKVIPIGSIPFSEEQNRINLETYGNNPSRKIKSVYGND
jgi:uncharacterized phage protein (TIGR02220 family)